VRNIDLWWSSERLVNDAIALGQAEQGGELFFTRIGVQIEAQSDLLKTDRNFFGDGKGSAEVEIAFGPNGRVTQRNVESGGNGAQSDAGTSHQRFEQHVPRARAESVAPSRGMKARFHQRFCCCDIAGKAFADFAFGTKSNRSRLRFVPITLFERCLQRFQFIGIHLIDRCEIDRRLRREPK